MAIAAALLTVALFGVSLGAGLHEFSNAQFVHNPLRESLQGKPYFKALNTPTINAEGYVRNTEYIYEYESQVLTGIPQASNQYAGVKVKALCVIEFLTDTNAILKLEKVNIMQLNGHVLSTVMPPKWQLPESAFQSLSLEQEKSAANALTLPVKFTYNNGIIGGLEVLDGDAQWSINVKKAVLNLLQVNINIKSNEAVSRKKTFPIDSNPMTVDEATGSSAESVYRLMEDGIDGKCASIYKIHCPQHGSKYLRVTKVRDYANCLDRKNYTRDSLEATRCAKDAHDSLLNPMSMTGHADFELMASEDRNKFIIKKATFGGQHLLNPYSEDLKDLQNYAAVYTNQTLRLLEERPSTVGITYEALKWKIVEEPLTLHLSPDAVETLELTSEEKLTKVAATVEAIEQASRDPQLYDQHLPLFFQLMTIVKKCRTVELEALWRQYALGQENEVKHDRKVLLDAMITVGSEKVSNFLLEKIENGQIQDANTVWHILTAANINKKPTINKIEKVSALVDKFSKYGMERKAALFALGSLTHRYIREAHVNMTVGKCDVQTVNSLKLKVAKKLQTLLSTTTCAKEMIMVLKAIGNAGIDELFIDLVKIAQDKQGYPADVRAMAIYAMGRLSPQMNLKIQQALLPIFAANQEDSHVRQVACHNILKTRTVSMATLEFIVRNLQNVDIETATLVLRKMRAIATMAPTTNPCLQRMKRKVAIALKMAKAVPMSPFVNYHRVPLFTAGPAASKQAFLDVAYVGNAATKMPKAVTVRLSAYTAGAYAHLLSVRYKAQGMDKILSNIRGFASQAPLSAKQAAVNKALNDEPRIIFSVRVFGKTVALRTLDENQIMNVLHFVKTGTAVPEMKVDVFKTFGLKPMSHKIPTLSGFPINLRSKAFVIADIKGHMQVQPSADVTTTILPNINFITAKPIRVELQLVGDLQVNAGIIKSGVALNAKIANVLNSQQTAISFNAAKRAINAKFVQPNAVMACIKAETVPSTYAVPVTRQQWKQFALDKNMRKEITGDLFALNPYQVSYGGQAVGAVLNVRGETPLPRYGTPQVEFAKQPLFLLAKRKLSLRLIPAGPANQDYEFLFGYKTVGNVFGAPRAYQKFPFTAFAKSISSSISSEDISSSSSSSMEAGIRRRGALKRRLYKRGTKHQWQQYRTQKQRSTVESLTTSEATSSQQSFPIRTGYSPLSAFGSFKGQRGGATAWKLFARKSRYGPVHRSGIFKSSPSSTFEASSISSLSESSPSISSKSVSRSTVSSSSSLVRSSSQSSSSSIDTSSQSVSLESSPQSPEIFKRHTSFHKYGKLARRALPVWARKMSRPYGRQSKFFSRKLGQSLTSTEELSSLKSSMQSTEEVSSPISSEYVRVGSKPRTFGGARRYGGAKIWKLRSRIARQAGVSLETKESSASSPESWRKYVKPSLSKFRSLGASYDKSHFPYYKFATKSRNVYGKRFGGRNIFGIHATPFSKFHTKFGRSVNNVKSWFSEPVLQSGTQSVELVMAMLVHGQGSVKETSFRAICRLEPNSGKISKFIEFRAGSPQNLWKMQMIGNSQVLPLRGLSKVAGFGKADNVKVIWGAANRPIQVARIMGKTSSLSANACVRDNILGCKDAYGRQITPAIKRTKVVQFGSNKVPYATRKLFQSAIRYLAGKAQEFVIERTPSRYTQGSIAMTYLIKEEDKIDVYLQMPEAKYQMKNIEVPWLSRLLYWYSVVPQSAGWPELQLQNEMVSTATGYRKSGLHALMGTAVQKPFGILSSELSASSEINLSPEINTSPEVGLLRNIKISPKISIAAAQSCVAESVFKAIKMTVGDKTLTCITAEPLPECSDACKQMATRHVPQKLHCFQPEMVSDLLALRHGRLMVRKNISLPANPITQLMYDKCVVAEQCI